MSCALTYISSLSEKRTRYSPSTEMNWILLEHLQIHVFGPFATYALSASSEVSNQ